MPGTARSAANNTGRWEQQGGVQLDTAAIEELFKTGPTQGANT